MSSSIVFVAASVRSGSTLLSLMLDAHPGLVNPGEVDFLFDHCPDGRVPAVSAWRELLDKDTLFKRMDLPLPEEDGYPSYRDRLMGLWRQRTGRPQALVTANIHRNFDRVAQIDPEARFIHLLRDPRDVALSCIAMGWYGTPWHAVSIWMEAEASWARLMAQMGPGRCLEVRYEDLVLRPEQTARAICDFLGLPFTPDMFSYAGRTSYSAPDPKLVEQWRRKMDPEDLADVEHRLGGLLTQSGYQPGRKDRRAPSFWRRLGLVWRNRWNQTGFWIRRYGLPLYVADRIVQRVLPLPAWREAVIARCEMVNRAHLK